MFSHSVKFKNAQGSYRFSLQEGQADLFFELNGELFTPNNLTNLGGEWEATHNFKRGDVFGAYVKAPIIQPYNIKLDNKALSVSYSLACLKQIELLTDTSQSEYALFPNYNSKIEDFAKANHNKIFAAPASAELAVLIEQESLQPAEGYEFVTGSNYILLVCNQTNGNIVQLVDDEQNVLVSQLARYSHKEIEYEVFNFSPSVDFTCGNALIAVDDWVLVSGVAVPKRTLNSTPTYRIDETRLSTINPRYSFDTKAGLIDYNSYLIGIGGNYFRYSGQLPEFDLPINDGSSSFTIEVLTKHEWDYRGIEPAIPELAEYISGSNQWTVTQTAHTGYWTTTFTSVPHALIAPQKYIWRYDDI